MMTNVCFFIFLLYSIKVAIPELLSQTIIKFEPFQTINILSLQHLNTSTFIDTKFPIHKVKKRQSSQVNNFLDQRIRGNVVPQCPCVIKPGTDKCITYDSRYQAASLEEALIAFPDLTLDIDSFSYPTGGVINAEFFACRTLECQTCAAILLRRLKQIGMVPQNQQVSIQFPRIIDPKNCRRLRFLKTFPVPNPPQASYYTKALIEHGLQYAGILRRQRTTFPAPRNRFWQPAQPARPVIQPRPQPVVFHNPHVQQQFPIPHVQPQLPIPSPQPYQLQFPFVRPQHLPEQPWIPNFEFTDKTDNTAGGESLFQSQIGTWKTDEYSETTHDRRRRKIKRKADAPVLGIRHMISCVQHGETDDDNMLALCDICWTWRKLPSDYFPPLINELICMKENQGHCLSGWGKCQQKYRNFDVLRKVNGNWQPTTISTATCCDCRIRAGTEIHPLVIGKRQN